MNAALKIMLASSVSCLRKQSVHGWKITNLPTPAGASMQQYNVSCIHNCTLPSMLAGDGDLGKTPRHDHYPLFLVVYRNRYNELHLGEVKE